MRQAIGSGPIGSPKRLRASPTDMGEVSAVWQHARPCRMAIWPRLVLLTVFEQDTCLQASAVIRTCIPRISITPAAHARRKAWIHPLSSELRIGHQIQSEGDHGPSEGR